MFARRSYGRSRENVEALVPEVEMSLLMDREILKSVSGATEVSLGGSDNTQVRSGYRKPHIWGELKGLIWTMVQA
jgi:hypothetical protein